MVNAKKGEHKYREYWYMRATDRVEVHRMCNAFELQKYNKEVCLDKQLSTTTWAESAIEEDFRLLSKWYDQNKLKKHDATAQRRIRDFEEHTLMCGKLCCPWRQARNLTCYMDYAENPF